MNKGTPTRISKERVGALTDGVVAIAATLLVLDLKIPSEGEELSPSMLVHSVHLFIGWVISIAMIATMWYEHHYIFRRTTDWDNTLVVLIFAQLAAVSLIPFASGIAAEYPGNLTAALVFSGVMLLNGLLVAVNALIVGSKPHLWEPGEAPGSLRLRAIVQLVCYVGIAGLSIALARLHHPILGVIAWSLSPFAVALLERHRGWLPSLAPRGRKEISADVEPPAQGL